MGCIQERVISFVCYLGGEPSKGLPAKSRLGNEHRNSFEETGNYSSRHSIFFSVADETGKNADPKRLTRIGNKLTCPCFDEQGTYWWPYCPPGWELCWSVAPFGECCI